MKILKKYSIFLVALLLIAGLFVYDRTLGVKAVTTIQGSAFEMLKILPPVFLMLGLLDVWVPRETMIRFMGEGSGLRGALLSMFIGAAAAGPLYVVFPVAAAFMKKGVKFTNILLLIGTWSTMKIPMLMFEMSSLGPRFMLTRLALNIPVILIITFFLNRLLGRQDIEDIYERARNSQ